MTNTNKELTDIVECPKGYKVPKTNKPYECTNCPNIACIERPSLTEEERRTYKEDPNASDYSIGPCGYGC